MDHGIVRPGEIALGAFNLDHPRPGIGQTRRAVGRGDRLFHRDDKNAFKRFQRIAGHFFLLFEPERWCVEPSGLFIPSGPDPRVQSPLPTEKRATGSPDRCPGK